MIHFFEGVTADDVWQKAATQFRLHQSTKNQEGRGGKTDEILHATFSISNPRQRWVVTREPAINPAFAIAEVVWILNGRRDSAFLNFWNPQLPKYAGNGDLYHGAYGYRLRQHFGLDQLEQAYLALGHNPASRQIVLQIWDVASDFPVEDGTPVALDIPCNVISMLKIREDKLEWMQIMRSNDLFRGVPYNFIQFTFLQEILAGWLEKEIGSYNHLSDSLHLYDGDKDSLQMGEKVNNHLNTDSLALPKRESDSAISKLNDCFELLISPKLTEKELSQIVINSDLSKGFRNLLLIAAAEAARKNRWISSMNYIAQECDNPMLNEAWNRWQSRLSKQRIN